MFVIVDSATWSKCVSTSKRKEINIKLIPPNITGNNNDSDQYNIKIQTYIMTVEKRQQTSPYTVICKL